MHVIRFTLFEKTRVSLPEPSPGGRTANQGASLVHARFVVISRVIGVSTPSQGPLGGCNRPPNCSYPATKVSQIDVRPLLPPGLVQVMMALSARTARSV